MKKHILFLLLVCPVSLVHAADVPTLTATSKQKSILAQMATDKAAKAKLANEGLFYAGQCLELKPDDVACLYYRAVNRGLDLETRFFNIKNDVHLMKADFEKVVRLDGSFDDAGANRALGFLFLQAPAVPILGKDIRKNLTKAMSYADAALQIAPSHAENILLKAQIQIEQDNFDVAKANLLLSQQNLAALSQEDQIRLKPQIDKSLIKVEKSLAKKK